jgi:hypothetical protein
MAAQVIELESMGDWADEHLVRESVSGDVATAGASAVLHEVAIT